MILSFFVPGPPQPKARPRRDPRGTWYTPASTRSYEAKVEAHARTAMATWGWRLTKKPVALSVQLRLPDGRRFDIDNMVKAIADACNGVLWHDDRQIARIQAVRACGCSRSGAFVRVVEIDEPTEGDLT